VRAQDQSGFTLIELLVSMISALAVLSAVVMITTVALHNQDRIADRVFANQTARPLVTRIVSELHSSCVAQHVTPILGDGTAGISGSTGTQISFLSKAGNAVTPTPEKHVIFLSGNTLWESVYQATSGSQPGPWTFSSTTLPNYPRKLATNVSGPGGVVFSYYQFVNGALATTPLTTPLSATDAAHASQVSVSLTVGPPNGTSSLDTKSPITLNDTVDLRLENAGQYPNQENLPCV
jgi:type II secretory pathway pseudopilin PulG